MKSGPVASHSVVQIVIAWNREGLGTFPCLVAKGRAIGAVVDVSRALRKVLGSRRDLTGWIADHSPGAVSALLSPDGRRFGRNGRGTLRRAGSIVWPAAWQQWRGAPGVVTGTSPCFQSTRCFTVPVWNVPTSPHGTAAPAAVAAKTRVESHAPPATFASHQVELIEPSG